MDWSINDLEQRKFVEVAGEPAVNVTWKVTLEVWDIYDISNSSDLQTDFTYLDLWSADQRIDTIQYSSVLLWKNYLETYNYWWVAWDYYITSITTS